MVTNEFPQDSGNDVPFVSSELSALSSRYDEIHILYANDIGRKAVQLPPNVSFQSLNQVPVLPKIGPEAIGLRTSGAIREVVHDLTRVRSFRHLGRLVRASVRGRRAAMTIRSLTGSASCVYTFYFFWGAWGAYAIPWLDLGSRATVVRFHGGDLYEERGQGYLPLRRPILRAATATLTISKHGASYLLERYPKWAHNVEVVPLGSPDRGPGPEPSVDPFVVVSCSALLPVKRVAKILEAVDFLARQGTHVRWIHFGDGPDMQVLLEHVAASHPRLEVVLKGRTPNEEVLDFYAEHPANVFVNASFSEGAPVSIMEALSFDIPVVAPAVGGIPELLPDETLGFLVDRDFDVATLANAMRQASELRKSAPGARRTFWQTAYAQHINSQRAAIAVSGRS